MTTEFIPVDEKKYEKKLRALEKQEKQNRKELDKMAERHYYKTELDHLEQIMRSCGASEESTQIALRGRYEYLKITHQTAVREAQRKAAQILADPFRPELPSVTLNPTTPIQAIPFSEVEQQQIQWLWENRIPLGKITILEGDPGMGKSLLAIDLAARVSTGQNMPDASPGPQGRVLLIASEDGAADTLKPRLEAAGFDPFQVSLLDASRHLEFKKIKFGRPFSLAQDLDRLEGLILQTQPILLILDPLTAILGRRLDSSRDQDIREVFTPLTQLAHDSGCAILIVRHLSKQSSRNPLYRGAGSIGIIAAARMGLIVTQDPLHEHQRILATTKNNLSKQACNLAFQIAENAHGVPSIQWLGEYHEEIESLLPGRKLSPKRQEIIRMLQASPVQLSIKEILPYIDYNYDTLQRLLSRMRDSGDIASPARGIYTTLGHPSLTKHVTNTHDIPPEQQE